MENIRNFRKVKPKACPNLVEMLERLLAEAKKGMVYSGVFVGENIEGGLDFSHSITEDRGDCLILLAGLDIMRDSLRDAYFQAMSMEDVE